MSSRFPDFSAARVLVAGDVMLDRYWHGVTARISPEAPVPVVKVEGREDRPGGAANVALNLAALGGEPTLLGVIGQDDTGQKLEAMLQASGIKTSLLVVDGPPTITKLRVVSRGQQLLRLDFEEPLGPIAPKDFPALFKDSLETCDVVILSDYAKGTLTDIQTLITEARAAGKMVLIDPKTPDFERYQGANLLTPNLAEMETMVGTISDDTTLLEKGRDLISRLAMDALLVTRGGQGMTLILPERPPLHLPAHVREVYDVTGAGDTVISVLAACLAIGMSFEESTRLSNLAAGLAVKRQGTAAIGAAELRHADRQTETDMRGPVTEEQLMAIVARTKMDGERVVMTNGCFDILHAGHVSYLREARARGDRLVIAVNDDASTRALKGEGRPVNTLSRRMTVLAALEFVDWVVPFSESTPERLICRVLPDLLVKGADYSPDEIAGAKCVRANGGDVQVINLVEGVSTTKILNANKNTLVD
ncbi:MAG: bifunctional D-glycero-beta-D-manno-heptose-7-phosphate kinase/D-glycero-beta-D-manno-heptose 1-phosphate adenylyltransferase HldE [Pseudomonadota bacterium]